MVYEFPDCLHGDELIYSSLILPYHLTTAHNFFEIILGAFNLYSENCFWIIEIKSNYTDMYNVTREKRYFLFRKTLLSLNY